MKIIRRLLFLLPLVLSCNQAEEPVMKHAIKDVEVRSVTKDPAKRKEAKECYKITNETRFYTNLSHQFDFRLTVFNNNSNPYPSVSVLKIYGKNGEFIQKVEVVNLLMFGLNLNEVSSFETKWDQNLNGDDNLYGTLIIEDFNFDGLYDIALTEGCAANGNARYHYYIQSENSIFVPDKFLTRKIQTYPAKRNAQKKQLTSSQISFNSCRETTVEYNDSLKNWKRIKEVIYE